MRITYLLIFFLFSGISTYAQTTPEPESRGEEIRPYDFQTKLIGGYHILFRTDDGAEYLDLIKNNKKIVELASEDSAMPYKSLGYVGADLTDYFVFVHSYGSGNPHEIELIKKSTGKNILKTNAWWIDVTKKQQVLLYSDQDVPTIKDHMILHNLKTAQKRYLSFPKDIFDEPMILNRIGIKTLTSSFLTIKYETNGHTKTKRYKL